MPQDIFIKDNITFENEKVYMLYDSIQKEYNIDLSRLLKQRGINTSVITLNDLNAICIDLKQYYNKMLVPVYEFTNWI